MSFHHVFGFPDWWIEGIYFNIPSFINSILCGGFKICVPIFAFLTGYTYINSPKTYKYSFKKIISVYFKFLILYIIFALFGYFVGHNSYSFKQIIEELCIINRTTMIFAWYILFYIISMLLLPLFVKVLGHNKIFDFLIVFIFTPLLFHCISLLNLPINEWIVNLRSYFPCILFGYITANYSLFEKIKKTNNDKINVLIYILLAISCVLIRTIIGSILFINMDMVYSFIFVYCISTIIKIIDLKVTNKVLEVFGKYSLSIWLVSCIFYNNSKQYTQNLVYLIKNPLFVMIWCNIVFLVLAFIYDYSFKLIKKNIFKKRIYK